jgi:Kdo2-lipid IVA lauroyltransferase/acyltransferase
MKKKGKALQVTEYVGFMAAVAIARALPFSVLNVLSDVLGGFLYAAIPRRRTIALENLRIAFGGDLPEKEIRELARRSCKAFFLTAIEMIRSPFRLEGAGVVRDRRYKTEHLENLFQKAKKIHDDAGGCIFVTPHLGNWELLPYVSSLIGIQLAIVMRPFDNPLLERAILSSRIGTGHIMIPKRNAMFSLERMLRKGISIGMLPDQSTSRGLRVDFFGRKATATPVPALLAMANRRPVVVVAACRTDDPYYFEGYVSDPIRPEENEKGEQAEIVRITREVNAEMEKVIRRYPEQYLWMHNRWKESDRKPIFANIG